MRRRHIAAAAALLGAAAAAGVLATTRTTQLGQAAAPPTPAELSARAAALDRAEAQVRRTVSKLPPALPPLAGKAAPATPELVIVRRSPSTALAGEEGDAGEHEDGEAWEGEDDD
jgi:hypothetical protein